MDILTRLDACAECEQAPLAPLLADAAAEIRMLRKDAERYRWLRVCDANQEDAVMIRGDCFDRDELLSGTKLDAAIDAAMAGANDQVQP